MVAPLVAAAGAQAALSAGQAIAQAWSRPQGYWEQERQGKHLVTVRRGLTPSAAGLAVVAVAGAGALAVLRGWGIQRREVAEGRPMPIWDAVRPYAPPGPVTDVVSLLAGAWRR